MLYNAEKSRSCHKTLQAMQESGCASSHPTELHIHIHIQQQQQQSNKSNLISYNAETRRAEAKPERLRLSEEKHCRRECVVTAIQPTVLAVAVTAAAAVAAARACVCYGVVCFIPVTSASVHMSLCERVAEYMRGQAGGSWVASLACVGHAVIVS